MSETQAYSLKPRFSICKIGWHAYEKSRKITSFEWTKITGQDERGMITGDMKVTAIVKVCQNCRKEVDVSHELKEPK